LAPKTTEFYKITQNNNHHAVHGHCKGHRFRYQSEVHMRLPTRLKSYLAPVIANYWSNVCCRHGRSYLSLTHSFGMNLWTHESRLRNLVQRNSKHQYL